MIKIEAIEIIKTFSKKEKSDFKDFISMGYFNKKKKLIELMISLLTISRTFLQVTLPKRNCFQHFLRKNKFSYSFNRKGNMKFRDEKFALAKIEAENIEYNGDGVGPLYAFVYIETIQKALIEKDRGFATRYIKKFTKQLEKAKQETMYNLDLSLLNFHDRKFDKTLLHLAKVNPFSASTKLYARHFHLKLIMN